MPEKKQAKTLDKRVLDFIRGNSLIEPGEVLLAGVSGGPDSTCLILVLNELKDKLGIKLHVAHLNHGLRGAEAEADARFVAGLSKKLRIPVTMKKRNVKAYQKTKQMSLEEAAREVRYAFFAELAEKTGATKVAVGHTANDHIETVLMHLIRGSGTRGLIGLRASNLWHSQGKGITVIRPLLEITREETEDYCRSHAVTPRTDSTNLSLSTLRNRLRLELLPLLRQYNPEIENALRRTAKIASDEIAYVDQETEKSTSKVVFLNTDKFLVFYKEELSKLHPAIKRNLLLRAIEKLVGDTRQIELKHIEGMLDFLPKPAGRSINLPRGLTFTNDYGRYILSKDASALTARQLEIEIPIKIPGITLIPGWSIEAELMSRDQANIKRAEFTAYLDADRAGNKLLVRSRKRGDRFQPLGMAETKKVGEFMIDAKVPRRVRKSVPIVANPTQIVWLVGLRIDERVKVSEETKRVLKLKFEHYKT
ncbi:MAG: tRNA lysidine(34) synthetase TilS [Chloroflexota bacterium]